MKAHIITIAIMIGIALFIWAGATWQFVFPAAFALLFLSMVYFAIWMAIVSYDDDDYIGF